MWTRNWLDLLRIGRPLSDTAKEILRGEQAAKKAEGNVLKLKCPLRS
jgi:hypothetical protein